MSEVAEREKLSRLLFANPEVRHVVARALEVEEEGRAKNEYYLGWEWHEIPLAAQKLRVLVEEGVIKHPTPASWRTSSGPTCPDRALAGAS